MNELQLANNNSLWSQEEAVNEIKKIYAPNLTDGEFRTFVEIGKATGLNPFKKEIWAVKFGANPAQIFVGRDGYRISIGRNPNYESHIVDAVYENDQFEMDPVNNKFNHKYTLSNRGKLMGAYCLVFMRNCQRPYYVYCDFNEYNLGQSLWKTKPATMIKKVAEAQCIRMALPNEFNGTYTEDELPEERTKINTSRPNSSLGNAAIKTQIIHQTVDVLELDEKSQGFLDSIKSANSENELQLIAESIKGADVSMEVRKKLAEAYRERTMQIRKELEIKDTSN